MIFLEEGEIIECPYCGQQLFYVSRDVDTRDPVSGASEYFLPIKPQEKDNCVCNNCNSEIFSSLATKAARKERMEKMKNTAWCNLGEGEKKTMLEWLNKSRGND